MRFTNIMLTVSCLTFSVSQHGDDDLFPIRGQPAPCFHGNDCGEVVKITGHSIRLKRRDGIIREYQVSKELAEGRPPVQHVDPNGANPPPWMPSFMNALDDLKVGDVIEIRITHFNLCAGFQIESRPIGYVSPVRYELADINFTPGSVRYHERLNAKKDWDEKGIAYPDHFPAWACPPAAPQPRKIVFTTPDPRPIGHTIPPAAP